VRATAIKHTLTPHPHPIPSTPPHPIPSTPPHPIPSHPIPSTPSHPIPSTLPHPTPSTLSTPPGEPRGGGVNPLAALLGAEYADVSSEKEGGEPSSKRAKANAVALREKSAEEMAAYKADKYKEAQRKKQVGCSRALQQPAPCSPRPSAWALPPWPASLTLLLAGGLAPRV
jgi:hypothetical protein